MRVCVTVLVVALLSGCGAMKTEDAAKSAVGKHIDEAVAQFGPPHRTHETQEGHTVYYWDRTRVRHFQGDDVTIPSAVQLWADHEDIVYRYRWEHSTWDGEGGE